MKIKLSGRIDSGNAAQIEEKIFGELSDVSGGGTVILDAADMVYISSAGLRVILRLKKTYPDITIINVNSDVYEILDMTGFTEMMTVEKAYRTVSVEGCEVIGQGANGTIYRIDQDNVVKVYNDENALEDIKHEREMARLALIMGVPTAISYDVVKVGNSYGSVFELLNAKSFSKIIANEPEKIDWCASEYVEMLKKIHGTLVPSGKLPDMKEKMLSRALSLKDHLPKESYDKLISLFNAVPHDDHMLHGDYHTKNLELQGDEVLLIDMDTLSVGHPVFELGNMYNAFIGFSELDHENVKKFQGFDFETSSYFWHKSLIDYLGTVNGRKLREVEDKARIVGYVRLLSRSIRRKEYEAEQGQKDISHWKEELISLLSETNTLLFTPNELELEADESNLPEVQSFIEERLKNIECSAKAGMQIELAVEEIFVNISRYAYAPERGTAIVRVEISEKPVTVTITFVDHGMPYDPLKKNDPDISATAEERKIGGLGIFLTKRTMDDVIYEYKDGQNILKLKKNL